MRNRGAFTAKRRRVLRLTRIQIRRSRRSLRKLARRVRVAALMRLFRAQPRMLLAGPLQSWRS
jgi:hypothetical protein